MCHWELLQYFNQRFSSVWSYCYRASQDDPPLDIKCLQFWFNRDKSRPGYRLEVGTSFRGEVVYFKTDFFARKWNHFCVTWAMTDNLITVEIFLNGYTIGNKTFTSDIITNGIAGSEDVFDSYFIIGQEPDSIGPPYEETDLFQGQISEVNMWDKVLDKEEILKLGTCQSFGIGNVIEWGYDQFEIQGAKFIDLPDKRSLCKSEKKFVVFPEKRRIEEGLTLCAAHGGKIFTPKNQKDNEEVVKMLLDKQECVGKDSFLAYIGIRSSNFVFYETDYAGTLEPISYSNFLKKPTLGDNECTKLLSDGTWKSFDKCNSDQLCTVCEFENSPPLLLRGLCHDSTINWVYYLRMSEETKEIYYDGYKDHRIKYSNGAWKIEKRPAFGLESYNISLPSEAPQQYPIGRKYWDARKLSGCKTHNGKKIFRHIFQ